MVTVLLTSKKNPKSSKVLDKAGRVLSETAVMVKIMVKVSEVGHLQ